MPRSMKDRTQPRVVDSFSVSTAEVEAQVERENEEMQREYEERNRPVPASTSHRETLVGTAPNPAWGKVIGPLPDDVYQIVFRELEKSANSVRLELRGAMSRDVDWETETGTVPFQRPPVSPNVMVRQTTPAERGSAVTNTKMEVTVPLPGPPSKRFPQYIRAVAFYTPKQSVVPENDFSGTYEVELRKDDR